MIVPPTLAFLSDFVAPEGAMQALVLSMDETAPADASPAVDALSDPGLQALAWLYLDALEPAHRLCQTMEGPFGAHLHAIVHRREGDYGNALYWYRQAGQPDGEGARLTRDVAAGDRSASAVERQREEWSALAHRFAT